MIVLWVEDAGLLCSDAVLPGSALASIDTRGIFKELLKDLHILAISHKYN